MFQELNLILLLSAAEKRPTAILQSTAFTRQGERGRARALDYVALADVADRYPDDLKWRRAAAGRDREALVRDRRLLLALTSDPALSTRDL